MFDFTLVEDVLTHNRQDLEMNLWRFHVEHLVFKSSRYHLQVPPTQDKGKILKEIYNWTNSSEFVLSTKENALVLTVKFQSSRLITQAGKNKQNIQIHGTSLINRCYFN